MKVLTFDDGILGGGGECIYLKITIRDTFDDLHQFVPSSAGTDYTINLQCGTEMHAASVINITVLGSH